MGWVGAPLHSQSHSNKSTFCHPSANLTIHFQSMAFLVTNSSTPQPWEPHKMENHLFSFLFFPPMLTYGVRLLLAELHLFKQK